MDINLKTIRHKDHRPEAGATVGDWQFDGRGNLTVRVSALGDPDYEFLVGLHEMVEAYLCHKRGIRQEDVDEHDRAHGAWIEPGEHPEAPYRKEHAFAESIERLMATELGVRWPEYEDALADIK